MGPSALVDAVILPKQNGGGYVWMQLKQHVTGSRAIVYDADRIQQPDPRLFTPEYWKNLQAIIGQAQGRGSALMLDTPYGPAVLRQYLRGGLAARFSRDRYLYLGHSRSRPFVEAAMLARLRSLELPVPEILAALSTRHGMVCSGALLMARIPGALPMADLLAESNGHALDWQDIGRCIRRFHRAGVFHADLNVRNILIDPEQKVWLIDFDRARIVRPESSALVSNLRRLHRSLTRESRLSGPRLEQCWNQLMVGYNDAS